MLLNLLYLLLQELVFLENGSLTKIIFDSFTLYVQEIIDFIITFHMF